MCGRVNVSDNEGVRVLLSMLGLDNIPAREPRWNVAPTQTLDVVQAGPMGPEWAPMSWGVSLPMRGQKGQMITRRIPNARGDKVFVSRLWKKMIARQRVLIPVNGFYEWRRVNEKAVQAFYITPHRREAMFLGAIARPGADDTKSEVAIVTTQANQAMSEVHDRMPVLLGSTNEAMTWLNDHSRESVETLLQPAPEDFLDFRPVSDYVNKSSNEGPRCIEEDPGASEPELPLD